MAAKKAVNVRGKGVVEHRMEFFASSLDAFFQDYIKAVNGKDRLGCSVAAARITEIADHMADEFAATVAVYVDGPTEVRCLEQQSRMVGEMINNNAKECMAMQDGETALAAAAPDRKLS